MSPLDNIGLDRRLQAAGILIVLGLLIEAWTLHWNNPISFLIFLGIGGLLIAAGIVIYLLALVSPASRVPIARDKSAGSAAP